MAEHPPLTLDILQKALEGGVAAIRSRTRLQPAGGPADKIFPPTHSVSDGSAHKYAEEKRRVDGVEVPCFLVDSVQSQANRMEQALLEAWRQGQAPIPVIQVDFSKEPGLEDLETLTSLDAPHRIADALLRDSHLQGQVFRQSEPGKAFTESHVRDATGLFRYCPTALVFGVWDSTGPRGGLGAKFPRALVSEIVAIGAQIGVKTASRIDPTGIEKAAGLVLEHRDFATHQWTLEASEAAKDKKGGPKEYAGAGKEGKGSPASVNHGNIPPSLDGKAGGVTCDHALQTTVLSLPALRRLRFRTAADGKPLPPDKRPKAELSARTALAALALAGVALARREGYDLRSRCLLIPEGPLELELVPAEGGEPTRYTLTAEIATRLLGEALQAAEAQGMGWQREPVTLKPAPKLAALIRKSRELREEELQEATA